MNFPPAFLSLVLVCCPGNNMIRVALKTARRQGATRARCRCASQLRSNAGVGLFSAQPSGPQSFGCRPNPKRRASCYFRDSTLVVLLCLAPLLIAGCITTSAPPNPGGVIQVWVEQSSVRVLRNGKTLCVIKPKLPRVEQWKLVQNDTAIVIKSRGTHIQDPAAVELFDVNTGALKEKLMTYSLYTGQPTWARGFEDR
jgi:hypothetical protein